jgi:hypothetical protein
VPWYPRPIIDVSGRFRLASWRSFARVSDSDSAAGRSSGSVLRIDVAETDRPAARGWSSRGGQHLVPIICLGTDMAGAEPLRWK